MFDYEIFLHTTSMVRLQLVYDLSVQFETDHVENAQVANPKTMAARTIAVAPDDGGSVTMQLKVVVVLAAKAACGL